MLAAHGKGCPLSTVGGVLRGAHALSQKIFEFVILK